MTSMSVYNLQLKRSQSLEDPNTTSDPNSLSDREFISLLISLYRDLPELWQVKSQDYLNKNKRNLALQKMLDTLKIFRPDYNEEKLKKKINVLRTNFNKEYNKIKERQSCASSDETVEPTLWYFNEFYFIRDQKDTIETNATEQPSTSKSSLPTKRKKVSQNINPKKIRDLSRTYFNSFETTESEMEILSKGWAIKLGRLAPDQRCYAEKIINDTLFEAEMGTLTRNGVHFLTSSPIVTATYLSAGSGSSSPSQST